jgi:hypothetical protein
MCLSCAPSVIEVIEPLVTPVMLSLWQRHLNDPLILDDVLEVFTSLSSIKTTHTSLLSNLIPPIVNVLTNTSAHPSGVVETMLNLLDILIKAIDTPLPSQLTSELFSIVLNVITTTDDHSLMQSGAAILKSYIKKAPTDIVNFKDGNGGTGLTYILNIVANFLNPKLTDSSVLYVGPLVTTIVQQLSSHLDNSILGSMLETTLRRLHVAKLMTLQVELLLVFASLYNSHGMAVIELAQRVELENKVNGKFLPLSLSLSLYT